MRPRRKKSVKRKSIPKWNAGDHTLFWRGRVVKHFSHEAQDQEKILEAFEKGGWQDFVETADLQISKSKLWATIKNLNQSLKGFLHFRREGSSRRIGWAPVKKR
jgi:dissimilatory sulfite reductase (desulfoviridin) alpha/beta subunit